MIELIYTNSTGSLTLKTAAETPVAVFETLAVLSDVFDEKKCGCCGSDYIRPDVRRPQPYVYFQWVCRDCGARLDVGQNMDKINLYIDRKNADGTPKENAGWYHYQPESGTGNPPPKELNTLENDLRLIASANSVDSLEKLVQTINREVKAGRVVDTAAITAAVKKRKADLVGQAQKGRVA